jgi:hypothetical protein
MTMGETGMSEMTHMAAMMEMPLPENTLPMMTGTGQFGAIEMGGMFTTVKVREGLKRNDYRDPGAYVHPTGSVAREYHTEKLPAAAQAPAQEQATESALEVQVRKPGAPHDHAGH